MRDLDRWKDKVEISLDGRQIFFLFFGSAVAACLIFVVGVLIGKRIEARALAMTPAPIEDPLAALDQLGDADEADEGLTFHKALAPSSLPKATHASEAREPISDEAKPESAEKAEKLVENVKPEAKPEPMKAEVNKPEPQKTESGKPEAKAELASKDKKPALPPHGDDKKSAPLPPSRAQVVAAAPAKKPDGNKPAVAPGHFTLQLSAFPEKSDAEEFMHKIQAAGYKPFLIASEIPGKGIFYRVRVGDYASRQAAVDAKAEFERKQRIIAYVAKL
jgi:cell division septation protein DedD